LRCQRGGREEVPAGTLGAGKVLELHHRQTGDQLEVAEIARGDAVAEFQSCHSDQQIGEWKAYAFGLIFTVDLPTRSAIVTVTG
jgi:hypothetical protein